MKKFTLLLFSLLLFLFMSAQPKSEIRAVWLTTNYALDWPRYKDAYNQKNELQTLLKSLKEINVNTIFLQVQCRGDVFWQSDYQPWSRYITGVPGQAPTYDLLQFAIDECHAQGMEIHAWIVPYPLGSETSAGYYGDSHAKNKNPELCVQHTDGEWYLDPGNPGTTEYLIKLYSELVDKYDLDGLNLDYTRYPTGSFPDTQSYNLYGNGLTLANWRRQNINNFVYALYDMMQSKKPDMKLGAAPIGAYESLPNASSSFTAYSHVYQDPVAWMNNERLDLAAPQVYWESGYGPHLSNWIAKSNGRTILAGLAAYKMDTPANGGQNWASSVITTQIDQARELDAQGICFFRTLHITNDMKGIHTALKSDQFKYPANIPPMEWRGVTKPGVPGNIQITKKEGNTYTISWDTPATEANAPVKYYCLYMSDTENIDVDDVKSLAAHYITDNSVDYTIADLSKDRYFTVTAFDKGYYESDPSATVLAAANVGIDNEQNDDIRFAQTDNGIIIRSNSNISNIQIYSINGMLVNNRDYNDLEVNVDTNLLNKGAYIVIVRLENGSVVKHKMIR